MEHLDVLVVGAGLSGIGSGHFLKTRCPDRTFAIFEARERLGGTWDLFRYPGIRSDSDMYTLGYSFKPWTSGKAIADGPSILDYLRETAREQGLEPLIRLSHRVIGAAFDTTTARWTVEYRVGAETTTRRLTCRFLHMCAGYYDYAKGHQPAFAGVEDFKGRLVHPQFWPEDLDFAGKRVVVIGSGATAVTLVPAMAETAAHVTMLQRSPTYMGARPSEDGVANFLRRLLPPMIGYRLIRWRNVLLQMLFYAMSRARPAKVKERMIGMVREELPGFDVDKHFTPRYAPWDQRVCLVSDGDLFAAMRAGKAEVVTETIDRFTAEGVRLSDGRTLPADIVVSATGLELQVLAGVPFSVDGRAIDFSKTFSYKGMMYSGVPNLASSFGYTNASWTLKSDLTAEYMCRLLNHMRETGTDLCTPVLDDPDQAPAPWLDFTSGYVLRAMDRFPKQGLRTPWKVHQNYALDLFAFRFGKLDDGVMRFDRARKAAPVFAEPPHEMA
jgi:cation diffusion facilitator CzcD-associated flavoprotein CzcO